MDALVVQSRWPFGVIVVQFLYSNNIGTKTCLNINNKNITKNVYAIMKFLFSFHDLKNKDPQTHPNGCNAKTNGISINVINLFDNVHFFGSVIHKSASANCMAHHPIKTAPKN